jgi:hypothetical protein
MKLERSVIVAEVAVWRISGTKRFWGPMCRSKTTALLAWIVAGTRLSRGRLWNWVDEIKLAP